MELYKKHVTTINVSPTLIDENSQEYDMYEPIDGSAALVAYLNGSIAHFIIPDSVTKIRPYAFYKRSEIREIVVPDTVSEIGLGAFSTCDSLTKIVLPRGLKCIENGMFQKCCSLTDITIPESL